jgi:hypothetical protein
MKKLEDKDVLKIFREEWEKKLNVLREAVDVALSTPAVKDGEELIIDPGLKVRHKKTGIRYTVDSVSPRDVILLTPEGETFLVTADEIEEDYELD